MAQYTHTKKEWKHALMQNSVSLFPDTPETTKEFIAGYTQAKIGSIYERREAQKLRNKIVKEMRSDGWQTWTEPESHMGGTDTIEYAFSASRVI